MPVILSSHARAEKSTGWEWGKKCHAVAPEHKLKACTSFPEGEQCSAVQGSLRKVLSLPCSHWQGLGEVKKNTAWLCNGLFGWRTGIGDFFFFFFPPREKPCHCNYFLKIRFKICVFVEWQEEMRETGKLLTSAWDTSFSILFNTIRYFLKVLNCDLSKGDNWRNLSKYVMRGEIECKVVHCI